MKKILLSFFMMVGFAVSAQVAGAKTIGVDYPTLADAFIDLNTNGVGVGGATINVPAGYVETAPSGGYMLGSTTLNATLSSGNTLVLQKSGSGVNPLFTAPVGTTIIATGTNLIGDAIFNFSGVDYMTIDGLDLQESTANTTNITLMEKGFAFYNLTATDGANYNTVQNCSITFLKAVNNNATGIFFGHYLFSAPATALVPTTLDGTNSNNKIYSNTITKSLANAINFTGYSASSPYNLYDQNNDIGGSSAATRNIITDFGGLAGGSFFVTSYAIYCVNQNNANVSNNNIQFASDGLGTVGVYTFGTNSTFTVNNNTINAIGQTYSTGPTLHAGIYSNSSGTNLTANNNNINISATLYSGAVGVSGISFPGTGSLTANGNTIVGVSSPSTFYGINSSAVTAVNISNNSISGLSSVGVSSNVSGIYLTVPALNGNVSNNKIYNLTANGSLGSAYGLYILGTATSSTTNVYNNLIADLKTPTASSTGTLLAGIYIGSTATTSKFNLYYNTIAINGVSSGTNFNSAGIYHLNSTTATTSVLDLRNNIISNNSTPKGTGNASALRRSAAGVSNYAATSNNNDFYGTSAVYWNGTAANTLAQLQSLSRDANSLNVNPSVLSVIGANADFLKLNPADLGTQALDNKGATIAVYTTDYAGATRDVSTPDMGAYEFTYVAPVTIPNCTEVSSPANVATGVTPNPTVLNWAAATNATSYKLTIGTASGLSDVLNVTGLTALTYSLTLNSNTFYYVKVTATNSIGDATGCIETSFTTGNLVYCGPLGYTSVEPITNVNFAGIDNTTTATTGGTAHEFFLSQIGTVKRNQSYTISLNGNTDGDFTSYYAVFIDWNQNGILDDAGESYFVDGSVKQTNADGITSTPETASIGVPLDAKLGNTRMRIKKEYYSTVPATTSNFKSPCLTGANFGQAEDYTLNVLVVDSTLATSVATKANLSVYPNPFQHVLNISDVKGVKSISVNDVSGRQIKNLKPSTELDLSGLKTGLYIVNLHMEDGTVKSIKAIKK